MPEPVIAQKEPMSVEVRQGKSYWWCACGHSKAQPFCDGSHKGTGFEPVQFDAEKDGTVFFCACKRTNRRPLCDGSHGKL